MAHRALMAHTSPQPSLSKRVFSALSALSAHVFLKQIGPGPPTAGVQVGLPPKVRHFCGLSYTREGRLAHDADEIAGCKLIFDRDFQPISNRRPRVSSVDPRVTAAFPYCCSARPTTRTTAPT
jgi:hypothetical protein